jgi:predicted kinase
MNDILLLNGTCGVGKSTTSLEWGSLRKGTSLEVDELRCFIKDKVYRREKDHQELFMLNMVKQLGVMYLSLGKDLVVDYVWSSQSLQELFQHFSSYGNTKAVFLYCSHEENMRRDNLRHVKRRMGKRVGELEQELTLQKWPSFQHKINTTNLELSQVISSINALYTS